jgi:protein-disulfide isomerase
VGSATVTFADVAAAQPGEFLKLDRERRALVERTLSRAVQFKLVELEAAERGVSPEDLVKAEVDEKLTRPTDEEVETWFRERGVPGELATASGDIRDYLTERARNQRYGAFLGELAGRYPVKTLLDPLRSSVASDGFPSRGPDDAPVTIVEFADFQCPYCQQLVGNLERALETYGDQVRFVYRHYPLTGIHPDAQKSAEASMCADDQGKFWEMHDAMFANQDALDVPSLKQTAVSLGLDGERFERCLDSGEHVAAVATDRVVALALGLDGTPGLFINGRFLNGVQSADALAAVIGDELQRSGEDGDLRRLEPVRVEVASEGFPARGPAGAPVTLVEFSDFQCPYCSQLRPVLDQVIERYGDQVRLVYRQYPVASLHPQAQKAAEASLCAHEQGRFWEMHDAMFADQGALAVEELKETARTLGLDAPAFAECLDAGRQEAGVLADLEAGREAGVRGTPALFINGRMGTGLQRLETLSRIIDDELALAGSR